MTETESKNFPDASEIKKWAKLRLWAGYLFIVAVLVFAQPSFIHAIAGVLLILIGVIYRLIASATLEKETRLCVEGIYSATRNPLYFGSFLIGLGFASLGNRLWLALAFALVLIPLYIKMIFLEETRLKNIFGDEFSEYLKSVPRFVPKFIPISNVFSAMKLERLKNSNETSSALIILLITLVLLVFHTTWLIE